MLVRGDATVNYYSSLRLLVFGRGVNKQAGDPRIAEFLTLGETQQRKFGYFMFLLLVLGYLPDFFMPGNLPSKDNISYVLIARNNLNCHVAYSI